LRYVPITHRVVPPLFAVNHVLTRGCAATAVRTLGIKDPLWPTSNCLIDELGQGGPVANL
jgi:hypothetical protein